MEGADTGDPFGEKPIRIYTLGRFSLVKNGEPIKFSSKTRKPVELLKEILARGGREVCISTVADVLWPNMEGDAAYNALNVTLHRLRKLIDVPGIISIRDGKLEINPSLCWVDVWEFGRHISKLDRLLRAHPVEQSAVSLESERLLALCHGPFLKGDFTPTIITARSNLHDKLLCLLDNLWQFWQNNEEWRHAREFHQRGLELEPALESLYQRLMVCHRELGQRAEAIMIFERCKHALRSHLNVAPSRQTEAIFQSLVADY
jgi:DNA-binding SARP family transcriptional activator